MDFSSLEELTITIVNIKAEKSAPSVNIHIQDTCTTKSTLHLK